MHRSDRHSRRVTLTLLLLMHIALCGCQSGDDLPSGLPPDIDVAGNQRQANGQRTDARHDERKAKANAAAQEQADAALEIKELGRQLAQGLYSRDTDMVKQSFISSEEFLQAFSSLVVLDNAKQSKFREAMSAEIAMLPVQIENGLQIYADTEARSKFDLSALRIDDIVVSGHKTRKHIVELDAFDYIEIYLTHPEDAGSRYLLKSGGGARLSGKWKFLEVWKPLVRVPR